MPLVADKIDSSVPREIRYRYSVVSASFAEAVIGGVTSTSTNSFTTQSESLPSSSSEKLRKFLLMSVSVDTSIRQSNFPLKVGA